MERRGAGTVFDGAPAVRFRRVLTTVLASAAAMVCGIPVRAADQAGKVWSESWTGGIRPSTGQLPVSAEVIVAIVFGIAWAVLVCAVLLLWMKISGIETRIGKLSQSRTDAPEDDGDVDSDDEAPEPVRNSGESENVGEKQPKGLVIEEIEL